MLLSLKAMAACGGHLESVLQGRLPVSILPTTRRKWRPDRGHAVAFRVRPSSARKASSINAESFFALQAFLAFWSSS
jgi:hypothetical protein